MTAKDIFMRGKDIKEYLFGTSKVLFSYWYFDHGLIIEFKNEEVEDVHNKMQITKFRKMLNELGENKIRTIDVMDSMQNAISSNFIYVSYENTLSRLVTPKCEFIGFICNADLVTFYELVEHLEDKFGIKFIFND